MLDHFLSHLRVLDLSDGVAGAHCTALLAGLGADVIKVEPPQGDPLRRYGPFPADQPHPERGALFLYENTGKRSVTLDLRNEAGASLLLDLARRADAVIESFPRGTLDPLGLGYATLSKENPRLVLTSITWFGQNGPYGDWSGGPMVTFAQGGLMHLSGEPEREPLRMPSYVLERIVALNAFSATLAATYEAETSGQGQTVDVSFMETVASIHEHTVPTVVFKGEAPRRVGNLALPWVLVPCKDGYLGFNGMTAGNRWERLCNLLGMPELRDDQRFKDGGARNRNGHELAMVIYQWAQDKEKNEVFRRAQKAGLPLGYVQRWTRSWRWSNCASGASSRRWTTPRLAPWSIRRCRSGTPMAFGGAMSRLVLFAERRSWESTPRKSSPPSATRAMTWCDCGKWGRFRAHPTTTTPKGRGICCALRAH